MHCGQLRAYPSPVAWKVASDDARRYVAPIRGNAYTRKRRYDDTPIRETRNAYTLREYLAYVARCEDTTLREYVKPLSVDKWRERERQRDDERLRAIARASRDDTSSHRAKWRVLDTSSRAYFGSDKWRNSALRRAKWRAGYRVALFASSRYRGTLTRDGLSLGATRVRATDSAPLDRAIALSSLVAYPSDYPEAFREYARYGDIGARIARNLSTYVFNPTDSPASGERESEKGGN